MNPAISPISFHASMLQAWSAFSDELIAVWDDEGKDLLYFNAAYTHLFGYVNREDFIREYSFLGFRKHRLDLDLADLVLATIKRNGHWSEEVLFKKRDGDIFLGKLDITGFIFEGKTFYLQRVINIDTQRIFSENLFREIKKFEALFQYATLPILLVNKEGGIILANEQATILFEYSIENITKLKVEDLIPERFKMHHHGHRADYAKHRENRPMGRGMELWAVKKTGQEFPVEISLGHYMIDEEPYVIAFIIDITKRMEAENTLRRQKEEVEKVNLEIL